MRTENDSIRSKAAALTYLTLSGVLCALGFLVAILPQPWWYMLVPMAILAAVMCAASVDRSLPPAPQIRYIARLHLQSSMQLLSVFAIIAVLMPALVYALGVVFDDQGWLDKLAAFDFAAAAEIAAIACFVGSFGLTCLRLEDLKRKQVSLTDLGSGKLRVVEHRFALPLDLVRQRLDERLDDLLTERIPEFSRLTYGRRPGIRRENTHGLATILVWRDCPGQVRITLTSVGERETVLRLECELRGGMYRLNFDVSPHDMLALMTYLRINVVQPLAGELALSDALTRQDELRMRALEMQLRILQAQIEPHFLFNTLANLRQLYRTGAGPGEAMLDHLIAYLRSAMFELRSDASTVAQEFDLVLHYLAIMKIRMGERLSYSFTNTDGVARSAFPPAMLISLVENAIRHGLQDRPDGEVRISAEQEGTRLRVSVRDNGAGFSSVQGTGLGLSNIRQRLEAIYGNEAWLEVGALADGGFIATIVVPFVAAEEAQLELAA
ncbi:MAG TPA: histidine kinase [Telluria sp.]